MCWSQTFFCIKVNLAQAVVYMARAPKSIEVYAAYGRAKTSVQEHKGPLPPVPLHLRNAPTRLMKELGYGKGYKYNPAFEGEVEQTYMPSGMEDVDFFTWISCDLMHCANMWTAVSLVPQRFLPICSQIVYIFKWIIFIHQHNILSVLHSDKYILSGWTKNIMTSELETAIEHWNVASVKFTERLWLAFSVGIAYRGR